MPIIELSPRAPRLHTRVVWAVVLLGIASVSFWLCRSTAGPPAPKLNVVHVGDEMTREGYAATSWLGGLAIQLPEHNDARMFRVDPTDRLGMFQAGGTLDYFLEDPWQRRRCSRAPLAVSFDRFGVAPDVFVIDGNLWIDSHRARYFVASTAGKHVTLVVHGDVHIGDDVVLRDGSLTIVALRRSNGEGGAIYVDDPTFSTPPRRIDARLAAESGVNVQAEATAVSVLDVSEALPRF